MASGKISERPFDVFQSNAVTGMLWDKNLNCSDLKIMNGTISFVIQRTNGREEETRRFAAADAGLSETTTHSTTKRFFFAVPQGGVTCLA